MKRKEIVGGENENIKSFEQNFERKKKERNQNEGGDE